MTYSTDQLEALDRECQMTADRRLLAHLTVSGASIPDASPESLYPGVPLGSRFLSVEANPGVLEAVVVLGGFGPPREEGS